MLGGGLMLAIAELVGLPFLVAVFAEWVRAERVRTAELDRRLDRESAQPQPTVPAAPTAPAAPRGLRRARPPLVGDRSGGRGGALPAAAGRLTAEVEGGGAHLGKTC
ncbi:hypothetical protein GCM10020000_74250 [Streptomyces olivoverticillatus]